MAGAKKKQTEYGEMATAVADNVFIYPGLSVHIVFLVVHNIKTHLNCFVFP